MNVWKFLLDSFGWKVDISVPWREKCVICVAPHTSNWDFILGLFAYKSLGREANFLMKKFWFFFPLKYLLYSLGGIPVVRKGKGKGSLTDKIIKLFNEKKYINLAVTPEGTRSATDKWKTGFLFISYGARVPIQLGVIDYKNKMIRINQEYDPTGNADEDLRNIRKFYEKYKDCARYPEKFIC
ncbi:MAG: 1-acyl-sn-glycerol-3-phosphate acyltransferase [Muribaculaceae bacterium]|nr:1-acyl-sn-glycerol-3-phosphate acyltransferase [Muribaculaceae bacterium]MDE6299270.1 1-acyl-sn-glycerol-3-phosphate acyltransferase [Muribaculaceae bacterium]